MYSLSVGMAFGCKPAELSNTCDAKTKEYFQASVIRYLSGDRSPSCLPSFDFQDLWGVYQGSVTTTVNAITSYNDQIIIGGDFRYVGPSTGNVVYLETANGKLLPNRYCPYLKVVGSTGIAISDGNGGFYIGGEFFAVQGVEKFSIAHILPGCQLDRNFTVLNDNNKSIYTLLLAGDFLYAGGYYTDDNSGYLVRVNRYTGALDTSFTPNPNTLVSDLETDGDSLYVCGDFTNIGGYAKTGLVKFSLSTGLVIPSFTTTINGGSCLDLYYGTNANGSPVIYAVGDLTTPTFSNAISLFPDGTLTTWNPNPNAKVNSIQQYNNTIYLGGDFTTINGGTTARHLVSVNNGTGSAISTNFAMNTAEPVATLQIIENTLYLTGEFTSVKSVPRNYAAALSLPDESVTAFNPAYDGVLANPGSGIVSAGNGVVLFTSSRSTINVTSRNHFAVLDEVTGTPIEGTPNFDFPIKTLHRVNNRLFVGGSFTSIAGQSRNRFAILDLPNYQISPINTVLSGSPDIRTITSDESQIYVGGFGLANVNSQVRNGVFALNSNDFSLSGWNPNLGSGSSGESILVVNDSVFIGGSFSEINGVANYNNFQAVDKINGTRRDIPSPNNDPVSLVYNLTLAGTKIYMGGFFNSISGIGTFNNTAVYDLISQTYVQPNPVSADNMVNHVAAYPDGNILIGGSFTVLNGIPNNYSLGVFNTNTNTLSPWKASINDVVYTSMNKNGKYYLGGAFTIAHKRSNGGLVRSSLNE
ncbi:hypothetical protein EHQ24_16260 [Leptospira noumeaensis]|uniref:Galactose oxidase n=1 Tax=Leptospira noumeaensis TaxID=2484964 RepID=A0A4R9I2G6_9LEPT|nr:hypothetical protein EHQ24_16260 [Leptospira noumeaensis]